MQENLTGKDQEIAKINSNMEKRIKAEKQESEMGLKKAQKDVEKLKVEVTEKEDRLVKVSR